MAVYQMKMMLVSKDEEVSKWSGMLVGVSCCRYVVYKEHGSYSEKL